MMVCVRHASDVSPQTGEFVMRKSAPWIFAFAAALALTFAAACMSGDDDDDDDFQCDFGQHDNQWGPNSPLQECVQYGGMTMEECLDSDPDMAEREIEWRCHCNPDSCERWKESMDRMGYDWE